MPCGVRRAWLRSCSLRWRRSGRGPGSWRRRRRALRPCAGGRAGAQPARRRTGRGVARRGQGARRVAGVQGTRRMRWPPRWAGWTQPWPRTRPRSRPPSGPGCTPSRPSGSRRPGSPRLGPRWPTPTTTSGRWRYWPTPNRGTRPRSPDPRGRRHRSRPGHRVHLRRTGR